MIESRLKPSEDGLSHLSRYKEHTVAETAELFRGLAQSGTARSVSSILRIVAEQADGRQIRRGVPIGAMVFVNVPTPLLIYYMDPYSASPYRERQEFVLGVVLLANVLVGIAVWKGHQRNRRYRTQMAEIRRLGLEALDILVGGSEFKPKPLTREERRTFESLRKFDTPRWVCVSASLGEGTR